MLLQISFLFAKHSTGREHISNIGLGHEINLPLVTEYEFYH